MSSTSRRLQAKAEEYREKLIETVVEVDEAMEAYLEGNMPDNDNDPSLVRKGTCEVSSSRLLRLGL
jgi:elongation factor G